MGLNNSGIKPEVIMNGNSWESVHGTPILGVLCCKSEKFIAMFTGTSCNVMNIKILEGNKMSGTIDEVINGIKYAEDNGVSICCLSISIGQYNDELYNLMKKSKMLFVVSAGNNGAKIGEKIEIFPAGYNLDNIITVGDIRCDGQISKTSNYGSFVDVYAQGTYIVSAYENDKYIYLSETSFAVPYVAGLAAMVYSCSQRELSMGKIKDIILQNGK